MNVNVNVKGRSFTQDTRAESRRPRAPCATWRPNPCTLFEVVVV